MNIQQFSIVIGYVVQDLLLNQGENESDYWTKFSILSRQGNGYAVQIVCVARGDTARKFVEQHTKGSIVCLFGEIVKRYDQFSKNKISNQLNVLGWFYFADINAHFDDLNDEETAYLTNRLKRFRDAKPTERKKLINKITQGREEGQ